MQNICFNSWRVQLIRVQLTTRQIDGASYWRRVALSRVQLTGDQFTTINWRGTIYNLFWWAKHILVAAFIVSMHKNQLQINILLLKEMATSISFVSCFHVACGMQVPTKYVSLHRWLHWYQLFIYAVFCFYLELC